MVAFDNNALGNQFLQGWLIQDRFLMMNAFGAPYEFLWANPYQPASAFISFLWCSMTPTLAALLFDPAGMKTPIGSVYTRAKRSCFATAMSRW